MPKAQEAGPSGLWKWIHSQWNTHCACYRREVLVSLGTLGRAWQAGIPLICTPLPTPPPIWGFLKQVKDRIISA